MAKIVAVEVIQANLKPKVKRTDAVQSFELQETPIVRIVDADGAVGLGYSYTIGTGGSSVCKLIDDHLAPALIGAEAEEIEAVWRALFFRVHATAVGAITSIALAAIDTALWDLRACKAKLPLHRLAGGAKDSIALYYTEGGWLHMEEAELVEEALNAQARGFGGTKIKVGRPHVSEDMKRLSAVRERVGDGWEIMTDANQGLTLDEAIRRVRHYEKLDIAWFEEPIHADDVGAHRRLSQSTTVPIAVGESMYSISQFKDYLEAGACSIVQVDVGRIGGITPWLKVAHMAEAFNVPVCPHFLMELHLGLCCAVPNSRWLEYIPQLDLVTASPIRIENGRAMASDAPGLGIDWDWEALERAVVHRQAHGAMPPLRTSG
ncbi:mandelate racemase/muconate lactonizing enzyme family protein [Herbaspirillum sp. LeCh32-8]|uniref:mandelate racemase/muconate lactonizing enzyme family protein n=1 Tax=Herbaspirillum sp. LeCh32-8 TaxID=2821356 RepID=UPI001AE8583C|nr:mandelate racemase/muconate lactonizing enzyme family protein [Herbaspirillum sp. LeCh32-8]MBP0597036.1 mandelate racemase/muconate lactonizing enzyme family protein [Herbaspirillum sp. LeCh32-8]